MTGTERQVPQMTLREAYARIETQCGAVYVKQTHGSGKHTVIFLPEAADELRAITSYGRRSPMNAKEQKFMGYGHFLKDGDGFLVVVSHLIELQTKNRTAVSASNLGPNGTWNPGLDFLEYHYTEFFALEKKYNLDAYGKPVDPFLSAFGGSQFVLDGHTHPDLGAFYSGPDRENGRCVAAAKPVCIFVCDPVRREMLASVGKDMEPARVMVYGRKPAREPEACSGPAQKLSDLAAQCLQTEGCTGTLRVRKRLGGGVCMRLKLVLPREPEREKAQ